MQEIKMFLNNFNDKKCNIKIIGFMEINIIINELKYEIKNDIINLEEKNSNNKIAININQVYKIQKTNNLNLYLDNDVIVIIGNN